jgi:hypothetical protein
MPAARMLKGMPKIIESIAKFGSLRTIKNMQATKEAETKTKARTQKKKKKKFFIVLEDRDFWSLAS